MSSFVNSNSNSNYEFINYGEKGQKQYTWSNNIQERIVQLNFQLVRTQNNNDIINLNSKIRNIFLDLKNEYELKLISKEIYKNYIILLSCLLAHTRDIICGKGEYCLSYNFLNIFYDFYPQIAEFIYKYFFMNLDMDMDMNLDMDLDMRINKKNNNKNNNLPYGSWKDIKYFYKLFPNHPLNNYAIQLVNNQLKKDEYNFNKKNYHKISLVSKWIPREKKNKQYYKLYNDLACDYYNNYIINAKKSNDEETINRAINKAKTHYRQLISRLNKSIETLQIYQCSNNWRNIDFNKQTSINLLKQRKAFLNINKDGTIRNEYSIDRIQCAKNFNQYIEEVKNKEKKIKGKIINLNDFTKEALKLINNGFHKIKENKEIQLLNEQWKSNCEINNNNLKTMIAMVDVSHSMNGDPLYAAIALGIRVAEKSILGKRILTFSASPRWINFGDSEFVDCVYYSTLSEWGLNTNFISALKMILDAIIESKLEPQYVENMTLAVFSDMQIDKADTNFNSMYNYIENQYYNSGIKLYGKPFKMPHILFWNLRNTDGFPCLSSNKNISMISGFNPSLLNLFCEKGLDGLKENKQLKENNSWTYLNNILNNKRYSIIADFIEFSSL